MAQNCSEWTTDMQAYNVNALVFYLLLSMGTQVSFCVICLWSHQTQDYSIVFVSIMMHAWFCLYLSHYRMRQLYVNFYSLQATSRLLVSYPETTRNQILDFLFLVSLCACCKYSYAAYVLQCVTLYHFYCCGSFDFVSWILLS